MAHNESERSAGDLLPLRPIDLQILLVLIDGDLHGYGLMKEVERQSKGRVRLEVGSLYRVLKRLLVSGLVEAADEQLAATGAERRRNYRITDFGRQVAAAEADRLVGVIETARSRELIEGDNRA